MKKSLSIFVIIFSIVVSFSNVYAEQKKPAKKAAKTKSAKSKYTIAALNLDLQKLSANYYGHNIVDLYEALDELTDVPKKGDFETTEKYQARLTALKNKPLIGKLGRQDIFALSLPTEFEYNADSSLLKVSVATRKHIEYFEIMNNPVFYLQLSSSGRSYIGSNAFGATTEVSSRHTTEVDLVIYNPEVVGLMNESQYYGGIVYKFENFPIEKAKLAKNKIRALMLYKLREPYATEGRYGQSATYDSPYESYETHYNVHAELVGSWIYNIESGEILLKERYDKPKETVSEIK